MNPHLDAIYCIATTKKGERCKNCKFGGDWCCTHDPNKAPKKELPLDKRCTFIRKNGERCKFRKYRSIDVCRKHISLFPKDEVFDNLKVIEVFDKVRWLDKKSETLRFTDIASYDSSGRLTSSRSSSGPQSKIPNIKLPLFIEEYTLMYVSSSSYNFRIGEDRFLSTKPSLRYFVIVSKSGLFDGKELIIYDKEKCNSDIKKFELILLLPVKFDSNRDRLVLLSENAEEGKIFSLIERDGTSREKVNIDIFKKNIEVISFPIEIVSHYFSKDEISSSLVCEDYIFEVKKIEESKFAITQSFLNSGLTVCRYHLKEQVKPSQKIFSVFRYSRNQTLELTKTFYLRTSSRFYSENFKIIIFDKNHPLRVLNEARILSLILKRVENGKYLSFVINKILMKNLLSQYHRVKEIEHCIPILNEN